mmetsp:Transcript_57799/g.102625  ORF Transcript_57799/g.102625 Transcript_57799/m.102625 type:complete len:515 (+) Transcript_57799:87-1631(+)
MPQVHHTCRSPQNVEVIGPVKRLSAISRIRSSMRSLFSEVAELEEESDFQVFCEAGHLMSARIMREVYGPVCGSMRQNCHNCGIHVKKSRGCYRCHTCNLAYCMQCTLQQAGACPMEATFVNMGDIILTGPFATVTHVILAASQMVPTDEFRDVLKIPEGFDLYTCNTIETSPIFYKDCVAGGCGGRLHKGQYFFRRDPQRGVVTVAGSRDLGSQDPPRPDNQEALFLFHPFRKGYGGAKLLDESRFQEAIRAAEESLCGYGIDTVVKVFLDIPHQRASLDASNFPSNESKMALMADLRRRWVRNPICVSLAIIVWQRYFELLHRHKGDGIDMAAAKDILRWMPLKCDQAYSSNLVKVLTARKWVMREDFCDSGPGIEFQSGSDLESVDSELLRSHSAALLPNPPNPTMQPVLLGRTRMCSEATGVLTSPINNVSSMSAPEVRQLLLDKAGIPEEIASKFLDEDVDGTALLELTEEDLRLQLGIAFIGQRKRILRLVRMHAPEEFTESRKQILL